MILAAEMVEQTIPTILEATKTGNIGDGKILVRPVDAITLIRTGEKDRDAI